MLITSPTLFGFFIDAFNALAADPILSSCSKPDSSLSPGAGVPSICSVVQYLIEKLTSTLATSSVLFHPNATSPSTDGHASCAVSFVVGFIEDDERMVNFNKKYFKWMIVSLLTGLALKIFVPTQTTLAAMYIVPKLAQSEVVQKGYESLNVLVEEWSKELLPEKKQQ